MREESRVRMRSQVQSGITLEARVLACCTLYQSSAVQTPKEDRTSSMRRHPSAEDNLLRVDSCKPSATNTNIPSSCIF